MSNNDIIEEIERLSHINTEKAKETINELLEELYSSSDFVGRHGRLGGLENE